LKLPHDIIEHLFAEGCSLTDQSSLFHLMTS
jgi:hypothetical protein